MVGLYKPVVNPPAGSRENPAMATYVALLRGINLGNHNKVPMAALRDRLRDAGFDDVATYVQSGNVVLRSRKGAATVADLVRAEVAAGFGIDVPVVVRTGAQLAGVLDGNPFLAPHADPGRQLHVGFLSAAPAKARAAKLDPKRAAPEELSLRGRELYLWTPNGLGRSKVLQGVERALGVDVTVRNWRTVTELHRMANG